MDRSIGSVGRASQQSVEYSQCNNRGWNGRGAQTMSAKWIDRKPHTTARRIDVGGSTGSRSSWDFIGRNQVLVVPLPRCWQTTFTACMSGPLLLFWS